MDRRDWGRAPSGRPGRGSQTERLHVIDESSNIGDTVTPGYQDASYFGDVNPAFDTPFSEQSDVDVPRTVKTGDQALDPDELVEQTSQLGISSDNNISAASATQATIDGIVAGTGSEVNQTDGPVSPSYTYSQQSFAHDLPSSPQHPRGQTRPNKGQQKHMNVNFYNTAGHAGQGFAYDLSSQGSQASYGQQAYLPGHSNQSQHYQTDQQQYPSLQGGYGVYQNQNTYGQGLSDSVQYTSHQTQSQLAYGQGGIVYDASVPRGLHSENMRSSHSGISGKKNTFRTQKGFRGHHRHDRRLESTGGFPSTPMQDFETLDVDDFVERQEQDDSITVGTDPSAYALPTATGEWSDPSMGTLDETSHQNYIRPDFYDSRYFKKGRVIRVQWSEPKGNTTISNMTVDVVHGKPRSFVIVSSGSGHSVCLAINSYGGQGLAKSGCKAYQHGIIFSRGYGPSLKDDEPQPGYESVEMVTSNNWRPLTDTSRVNYAKPYTVEHNVPVIFIGDVGDDQAKRMLSNMFEAIKAHHHKK